MSRLDKSCFVAGLFNLGNDGRENKKAAGFANDRFGCIKKVRLEHPLANAVEIELPSDGIPQFQCSAVFGIYPITQTLEEESCIFNGKFLHHFRIMSLIFFRNFYISSLIGDSN